MKNFLKNIWVKVGKISKKEFNSEPAHNKKYLKVEKESYNKKINIKEGSQCIYISVILIDSVYIKDKNYYPQEFLEKYKYVVREAKMANFITDNIEIYSDEENSDDSEEENSDEKIKIKKIKYINLFLEETRLI